LLAIAWPWQKYFYTSTGNNVMNYIVEMEDSGFVTGTVMPQFNPSCRIIRTDKSGDTLWVKKENWGGNMYKAPTYGYICSGYKSYGQLVRLSFNFATMGAFYFTMLTIFVKRIA